jgi:hypothetical protein
MNQLSLDLWQPEICGYCGEILVQDVLEYWPEERAWMFDTCCEDVYEDLRWEAEVNPREFGKWFEAHTDRKVRRTYSDDCGGLRLDFGLELHQLGSDGPIRQTEVKEFIVKHHRHNRAPAGWKWGYAVYNGRELVAVGWAGRPVARMLDHTKVIEVNRVCVNPDIARELVWNACSMIYGAAAREAKRRGYERAVTYTHEGETGGTLVASGWTRTIDSAGGDWDRPSRRRPNKTPTAPKVRWERGLTKRGKREVRQLAAA